MGYIRHDAIVVTSWKRDELAQAAERARQLGLDVIGPSELAINAYASFLVCPDGSNEGWDESDAADRKRAEFLRYLDGVRYEDHSSCLDWVALSYSGDDREAKITAHVYERPLKTD